ncbi:hypothetical protein R3P38DRAFT_2554578 [Favolaschia claudopus]|uniref:Uncharacterized protein n=1 Tax=Favolaschia claudopus TaxID=2862362 RepID=A0AAW0ACU6_9AGAR
MARSKKNLSKKKVPQQISVSSTPPLTALELRLIRDLLCAINNSDFAARFPWLLKKTWNVLGSRNPEVTEGCRSIGKKAMEMSLCILSLDVHGGIEKGLPIGLSDSLERCFYSEQVLFAILKKADEKQATRIASIGVPTAKVGQVRDGVMLFAGGMWSEGQDLTAVMSWVNGLFRSLVAVAIKSYKSV